MVAGGLTKTLKGERDIASLRTGDRILTRDNGFQPLRSIQQVVFSAADLARFPELHPVEIAPAPLFAGAPERPTRVAPHHRLLVRASGPDMLCDADEVLMAAKNLPAQSGGRRVVLETLTYVQLAFDTHELIPVDGFWSESLAPVRGPAARSEIAAPMPTFAELRRAPSAARMAEIEALLAP